MSADEHPGPDCRIAATHKILAVSGAPRVLILTTFGLDEYVYEALRAGTSGFLLKNSTPEHELVLGTGTIKTHVANVLMKLRLRGRTQAVVLAYESGLVKPGGGA